MLDHLLMGLQRVQLAAAGSGQPQLAQGQLLREDKIAVLI